MIMVWENWKGAGALLFLELVFWEQWRRVNVIMEAQGNGEGRLAVHGITQGSSRVATDDQKLLKFYASRQLSVWHTEHGNSIASPVIGKPQLCCTLQLQSTVTQESLKFSSVHYERRKDLSNGLLWSFVPRPIQLLSGKQITEFACWAWKRFNMKRKINVIAQQIVKCQPTLFLFKRKILTNTT